MNFRHLWRTATALTVATALAGCDADSTLAVENLDQPDVKRAFATPEGIEAILSNGFSQIMGATHGVVSLQPAMMAFALESYGTVANYGMNLRATIPRVGIDNSKGNATQTENFRDFAQLSLRGRTLANALAALDRLTDGGGSIGTAAADARARSFGFFSLGLANAHMALVYDSVGVSTHLLASDEIPALSHYSAAMDVALAQIDTAIAIANGTSFAIPYEWMRTTTEGMSRAEYIAFMRSMKARLRASVARNATERAAVNWALVVADAAAGISDDVTLDLLASAGWSHSWLNNAMSFEGWHGMSPYIIGMADTSGGYAAWIAAPRSERGRFLIHTPDSRFPAGATRPLQQAASPGPGAILPEVYFRNRPSGSDTPGEAWGTSDYDFIRFRSYRTNSSSGPWIWMSKVENDMLRAEGLIRLNRAAEAVPLINASREEHNLQPFPAGATATTRAPAQAGGSANSCVPRTPTGPGGTLECGTLFEAMKWEKRMETIFTGYGQWWMDSRGWGDLPENTALMWPVPFQELDARRQPTYSSQEGPQWLAPAPTTYGFGSGSR